MQKINAQINIYSSTDKRLIFDLTNINFSSIENKKDVEKKFIVVSKYGIKENRFQAWSRSIEMHSAIDWARWIQKSEKVECYLLEDIGIIY